MPDKNTANSGKLKIGDDWNAITIIALSQNNPLKAIAEFVENSIDAKAGNISLIRGKEKGEAYLRIIDDGEGIKDLSYVATHIGDSIKRKMKKAGAVGLQGEFGIGLLSFWTVGEELVITTSEGIEKPHRMKLVKGNPGYSITSVNHLFPTSGTELLIKPILPGIRSLSGERIQSYLASELRDRISKNNVEIIIYDKLSRKQFKVEPRMFHGNLLHNLPEIRNPFGEIYLELYINEPSPDNELGLYKLGTRVFPKISKLEFFNRHPWNSPYLEGIIDCAFLQLTPGTRDGVIMDDMYSSFMDSMGVIAEYLENTISEQKQAEEEKASKVILSRLTKAFRDAFVYLADLDYSWLNIKKKTRTKTGGLNNEKNNGEQPYIDPDMEGHIIEESPDSQPEQKAFFDYPGALYKISIIPSKAIISVSEKKNFKIIAKDKKGKEIEHGLDVVWEITEGDAGVEGNGMFAEFTAGSEPCAVLLHASVKDGETFCEAESIITVTAELIEKKQSDNTSHKGLPGYTYLKASGELWRSRYTPEQNIITINNGHPDFIYASKLRMRQVKYISKLFAKEMILFNFPGIKPEEALERMSELLLYIEEHL